MNADDVLTVGAMVTSFVVTLLAIDWFVHAFPRNTPTARSRLRLIKKED